MKIIDCEQYSEAWWAARRGLPTASSFATIITPTGKPSTQFMKYACELIAEEVSQENEERFEPNEWMIRGHQLEDEARNWFAMHHNQPVEQVGLMVNDTGTYGASPDGKFVDQDCGLEIKCPKASTHVAYLLAGKLPDAYKPQVHGQLLVSGYPQWRFCSYHPDFTPLVVDVVPDEYTEKLKAAVDGFVIKLDEMKRRIIK